MTDEQKWQIEGRVHAQLREVKTQLGLLRADITEHANKLKEASDALMHFLSDPAGSGPTGMTKSEYVAHFYKSWVPPSIEEKLHEAAKLAERLQQLEKQVTEF